MNPDLKTALEKFTPPFKYNDGWIEDKFGNDLFFWSHYSKDVKEGIDDVTIANEIARHLNDLADQAKEGM